MDALVRLGGARSMLLIQKLLSLARRHSVAQRAVRCRVQLHVSYALVQRGDTCLTSRVADGSAPRVHICQTARIRPSSAFGAAAWPCAPTINKTSARQARAVGNHASGSRTWRPAAGCEAGVAASTGAQRLRPTRSALEGPGHQLGGAPPVYGARRSQSKTRCCHCLRGQAVRQCRQPALNMVVECLTIAETDRIKIY